MAAAFSASAPTSTYIPSDDLFVAVFANSDEPASPPVAGDGAARRARTRRPLSGPSSAPRSIRRTLAPLFGVYRVGDGAVSRRFFSRDGKLYTLRDGGRGERSVRRRRRPLLLRPGNLNWFRVARRPDGAHVMEMHQGGRNEAELATRAGDIPPEPAAAQVSRATLLSYVGHYLTGGPQADIAMGDGGRAHRSSSPASRRIPLRPTSDTEFVVQRVNARIVFHSENGQVNRSRDPPGRPRDRGAPRSALIGFKATGAARPARAQCGSA